MTQVRNLKDEIWLLAFAVSIFYIEHYKKDFW